MPDQLTLALDARHTGQAANLAAGTAGHKDHTAVVLAVLGVLIRAGEPFHADHVHKRVAGALGGAPYNRNLVSSAIGRAAHDGVIRQADRPRVHSASRSRKGSKNCWWIAANTELAEAS